jgi:hypothetical protein
MPPTSLSRSSLAAALAFATVLSLGGVGCKKKAGDSCSSGQGVCSDGTSMLACVKGVFAAMPCHGAGGCAANGNVVECDNSLSSVGDVCDENGDYACSLDKKSALSCAGNKFVVEETCKGSRACTLKKDGLYCDNDISDLGDPCHTVGDYACTTDKKLALKCGSDHVMAPLNSCKGSKGCRVLELPEEKKVDFVCDDAVADVGDPCDENGEEACSIDRKSLLKCNANKFAQHAACAGGCSFDGNGEKFVCDPGAASVAAPAKKGKRR